MDRTEIKFGKTTTVARLPKFCLRSRALRKQPIPSRLFCCFGMLWQIQVEVTLAPIQGRLCYARLPSKNDRHASVINSCVDHNFFNRLIFGLYEINLQHTLALRIMSDYRFFLFATNLFPKSFKFKFIDLQNKLFQCCGVMPERRDRRLYFAHLFNYFNFANHINLFCSVILE